MTLFPPNFKIRRSLNVALLVSFVCSFLALARMANAAEEGGNSSDLKSRTDKIVSLLQRKYESTKTIVTKFQQENHLRSLGRTTRSIGRLSLRKPGHIRAEYTSPETQLVVSNGESLWIYTPRLKQVIVSHIKGSGVVSLPLLFLAGKGNLRREFRVTLEDEGIVPRQSGVWKAGQPHRLSLEPIKPVAGFRGMWIEADPVSSQITGIEYVDSLGNKTKIRFTDMKENAVVDSSLFEFEMPPGVDVLKAPGGGR